MGSFFYHTPSLTLNFQQNNIILQAKYRKFIVPKISPFLKSKNESDNIKKKKKKWLNN